MDQNGMGSGMGMKGIGRLGAAIIAALLTLGLGSTSVARAEAPSVTIVSPSTGTIAKASPPSFAGTTSDTLDLVTLNVYEGSSAVGVPVRTEVSLPVGNAWEVTPTPLADGIYTAVAQQTDSETLEQGFSLEVTFTVDSTAPVVTLNPVPAVTSKAAVSFSGTAGALAGDVETVSVVVYAGSVPGGQEIASGTVPVLGGAWSFAPAALADGTYTVQAFQTDAAGNEAASGSASFRVDTTHPSPLTLNTIAPVIASATPTLEGSGGEQPGDGPVRVLLDGKLVNEAQVSGGKWSYVFAHLNDGKHTVRLEQIDEAGNVSEASASFRVDTTAPKLTLNAPKNGDTLKTSLVSFAGTSSTEESQGTVTIEIVQIEPSEAGTIPQSFTIKRNGSQWSSEKFGPRLANGKYTVYAEELDLVGNKSQRPSVTFTVASPAPTVTLKALPRYTNDSTPGFSGTADTSSEARQEVTLDVWSGSSASGKEPVESKAVDAQDGGWNADLAEALPDGTYTAQVEQQAAVAKNPAGVSGTTTFTVDTTAPVPTISAPGESNGLETVSGIAGIAPGDRRQVTAELFQGPAGEAGAAFETITVNADQKNGTWRATFANLGGGQYTVVARQADEAGNAGASQPLSFAVNAPPAGPPASSPPSPPVASFTWVPAAPTVGQVVSFVSKSTDPSSPITGYAWDFAGSGPFAAGGALATTTFATPGAHTVRLQVTDANGLSSTVAETVAVAAPALKLMQPFPIVRIAGSETSSGAKVKLLTVQAPPAAKVAVSCKGRGCKTKSESRVATASSKSRSRAGAITLAFPRFQRALKAGAVLQIRVSRSGEIGKFTSFTIRRKKLPVRVDACLRPPSSNPSPCPS
jgi:large repetitive protein